MRGYFAAAARRGRGLVIASAENPGGRQARGYVGPMGGANLSDLRRHTHPGRVNQEKYVLITEPNAIVEGETRLTVTVDGKIYEVQILSDLLQFQAGRASDLILHIFFEISVDFQT